MFALLLKFWVAANLSYPAPVDGEGLWYQAFLTTGVLVSHWSELSIRNDCFFAEQTQDTAGMISRR